MLMDETRRERKEIYSVGSEVGWRGMEQLLREHVYADSAQWKQFFRILLPVLGVSLMVSGIVFFFAYNWAELHKFIKLGLIEAMLILTIALVLFTRWSVSMKQVLLTAASVLVGALFAVYGQIYQTGANAYDFFFGWTLFVTLWAVAGRCAPLWLLWIALTNITIYLYKEQVAVSDQGVRILIENAPILTCLLSVVIAESLLIKKKLEQRNVWFINTVALAGLASGTLNAMIYILSNTHSSKASLLLLIVVCIGGLLWGFRRQQLFYIATILFCLLLVLNAALFRMFEKQLDISIILLMGGMMVAGTTAIVSLIVKLKKQGYGTTAQ